MKNFSVKRIIAGILSTIMVMTSLDFMPLEVKAASSEWNFSYTGDIQEFTAPYTGKYYFNLYGASGGGATSFLGGAGSHVSGYYNLKQGQKIYIGIGQEGTINGSATYGGGGTGGNGTGAGGGATYVVTELINNGLLENYKENESSLISIAAGGGGKGSNQVNEKDSIGGGNNTVFIPASRARSLGFSCTLDKSFAVSSFGGGLFGKGNDYNTTSSQGYGGAGGGGYHGGTSSKSGYFGGAGGSNYNSTDFYDTSFIDNNNLGNGKASIKYIGKVESTVSFMTKDVCSIDGKTGNISIKGYAGDTIELPIPDMVDGAQFNKYVVTSGDGNVQNNTSYTFGLSNTILNIDYSSKLMIKTNGYDNEKQTIDLTYKQLDEYDKYYKVYQSLDKENWYFAEFSEDANGSSNPVYTYDCTGRSEAFTSKSNAVYNVVLYGAQGGSDQNGVGGRGGKTSGQIELKKGETIYITVGECGSASDYYSSFNGGGMARGASASYAAGGGGATHIATTPGVLSSFGNATNARNYVIAAAGGGGGCSDNCPAGGGSGGGTNGGKGGGTYGGAGGTQSSGYSFGVGQAAQPFQGAAGGGGWYGGYSVTASTAGSGGGGGSGYMSSKLLNGTMQNGVKTGDGQVILSVYDTTVSDEYLTGISVKDINAPDSPENIKIVGANNSILTISWDKADDNGTTYYHKVESYNAKNKNLLQISDIVSDYIVSGVKGYFYYIDNNSVGTANKNNNFSETNSIEIDRNSGKYLHIATVDYAGNVSDTVTFEIPQIASYKVLHQQEQLDGTYTTVETENLSGTIGSSVTPAVKSYTGFTSPSTQTVTISADGSTTVTYKYVRTNYTVTYKDVADNTSGSLLGQSTLSKKYGSSVRGTDIGSSTADNAYYNGYYYVSDTSATVGTSGATVYRIFKLRTINISGVVSWTDNSNKWGTRPNEVTVSLYRDGSKVDSITGLTISNSNNYSFNNVPKYSTSDGHVYNYTVSQGEAVSKTSPEDKYTTTQNTYNFTNVLGNTDKDADNKGLTVKGSIYWEDKGDALGYRPNTVTITLYQNGKEYKTLEVDSFNDNTYEFSKLPKYDKDLNKYEYTVKETMVANYLVTENGQPVLKDAYSIKADTPNALDFTNVFNIPGSTPIPVKPEHENTVTVKTNTEDMITISLKGMETIINSDLSVSYGNNYNGQVYSLSANNVGTTLSGINSGKYEISYLDATYVLNDIACDGDNNIWIEGSGDKYYLVIKDTNTDVSGTIILNFSKKDHIGYQTDASVSNYFKVGVESTSTMNLESEVFAISDIIIAAEDVYSVIYNNSDTIDENIYNKGDKAEVLAYEGKLPKNKELLGWSLLEDAEEPDYLVGDIISIKDMNISLYPVFKDIEKEISEMETIEETTESSESIEENSETEESTMEEKSSEEETFESEESSTESNFSEKDTSSTEEESTETIENSKLEK